MSMGLPRVLSTFRISVSSAVRFIFVERDSTDVILPKPARSSNSYAVEFGLATNDAFGPWNRGLVQNGVVWIDASVMSLRRRELLQS